MAKRLSAEPFDRNSGKCFNWTDDEKQVFTRIQMEICEMKAQRYSCENILTKYSPKSQENI